MLAVVIFGSVAKDRVTEESDVDLMIITEGGVELNEEIYELAFRYDLPIEATFITFEELLSHVQARTTFLLGVLEGYRVLHDRVGIGDILSFLKAEVEEKFSYDEEAGAWIVNYPPLKGCGLPDSTTVLAGTAISSHRRYFGPSQP